MFTGGENAYCPGIFVVEGLEKASSFRQTVGGLETGQTFDPDLGTLPSKRRGRHKRG